MRHTIVFHWTLLRLALLLTAFVPAGTAQAQTQDVPLKNMPRVDITQFYRMAVNRSLPLLQSSAATFRAENGGACFSCHHQTLPSMAVFYARQRGFHVDEPRAKAEVDYVHGILAKLRPLAEQAQTSQAAEKDLDLITVDPSISVAYALYGLATEGVKPDAATAALASYLMRKQQADGRWPVLSARPPLESSEFTATALAVRALRVYAPKNHSAETNRRITLAGKWLLSARPKTTEDTVFRLFGLRWTEARTADIQAAASELMALQQDDGAWGQTPNAPTDAYATGQALVALYLAGNLSVNDPVYRRGAFYLAANQQEDGSWKVIKRAPPVQAYFETGFPHGKDQFISCSGSSWATMALALALPEAEIARR